MAGEPAADAVAFGPVELLHRQVGEVVVNQGEERSERFLVAAVRRGGDQHHVAGGVGGDAAQEFVALLAAPAHPGGEGAAVRFVHDHELGAPQREVLGAARGLDEVGGHDGERVPVEDRYAERQVALQALDGARQHQLRFDVELLRKLALPLFGQVGRAQHGDAADLAAIKQLAGDEARLDGLADADVVGDEHAHRLEFQRHHQRHELVGPGLDGDAPEAAEGAGGGPGGETRGIAQQPAGGEVAEVLAAGEAEGCGFDRFDGWEDAGDLLVEPADGAKHQEVGGGFGEHDPLATAGVDEGAGGEWGRCVHGRRRGSKRPEDVRVATEYREPVVVMAESDDDVAHADQGLGGGVVLSNLVRRIVRRAVDVDGRGRVAIEEIGLGEIGGNPVLRVARQPESQLVHAVEPALLQPAVAALAQRDQALNP